MEELETRSCTSSTWTKNSVAREDKDEMMHLQRRFCGWGPFRPAFLQPFARVWSFIVFYLAFAFTHGVQGSYTISVLTTLEKRFNFPSFMSGSLVTVSTVGYIVSVIFVSFFFARKHQPRLFAGCMLITSVCALLYVIPHFIYGTGNDGMDNDYAIRNNPLRHQNADAHSRRSNSSTGNHLSVQLCSSQGNSSSVEEVTCTEKERKSADEEVQYIMPAMVLFSLSEILQGIAGAPLWTVGMAYIDDHTNPELSAKLIGLMFTFRFIAPMASFALGGFLLSVYANLKDTDLTPENPQWIGAWWVGYLVCSIVNLILFIPTSMLPKALKPINNSIKPPAAAAEAEAEALSSDAAADVEKDCWMLEDENKNPQTPRNLAETGLKELAKVTVRLVFNPIYMFASITVCIDCLVLGYMAFLPKYFEVHFQQTAWMANILGGMTPAIFGGLASYVSGVISGKIKGNDGGVAGNCKITFLMSLLSLLLLIPAMIMSCPDIEYSGHLDENGRLEMSNTCNADCSCSTTTDFYDPVCGENGLWFFSPCFAGCLNVDFNLTTSITSSSASQSHLGGCRCVGSSGGAVDSLFCSDSCPSMIPYVVAIVAIFISINLYNVPYTNIILRCIREEDKSFALGLQTFAICLCIFPAPIFYGAVFDSACILRETTTCTDSEGACLLYDRNLLRRSFHGLTIGLRVISTLLYFLTYFLARRKLIVLNAELQVKKERETMALNLNGAETTMTETDQKLPPTKETIL